MSVLLPTRARIRRVPTEDLPAACRVTVAGLLAALLLAGCAAGGSSSTRTAPTPTPTASPTAIPTAPPVPTSIGHPSPVLAPLAPPPRNCHVTSPPQQMTVAHLGRNSDVPLVGGGPFWILGFYYQSVLHLEQGQTRTAWPGTKMVVEVGPNYAEPVTLRLRNQVTGALAWWTDGGTPPGAATQTLVLDPQTDNEDVGRMPGVPDIPHGQSSFAPSWYEWGIFPLFSAAGCYELEVSWSGGAWRSVFAAGR